MLARARSRVPRLPPPAAPRLLSPSFSSSLSLFSLVLNLSLSPFSPPPPPLLSLSPLSSLFLSLSLSLPPPLYTHIFTYKQIQHMIKLKYVPMTL